MSNTFTSKTPSPAVLHFQGRDLEAVDAAQIHHIELMRRLANLVCDQAETMVRRQAATIASDADAMPTNRSFERDGNSKMDNEEQCGNIYDQYLEIVADSMQQLVGEHPIREVRPDPLPALIAFPERFAQSDNREGGK